MSLMGLLLGNSTLRYGVLEGGTVREAAAIPWERLEERASEISTMASRWAVAGAVGGSVRDELIPALERHLPPRWCPLALARKDFPIPIQNLYERPEEAGTDRLLVALAAGRRAGPSGAVTVDFGTAVSIGVVSPEGAFLGGPIAAGASTVARGLAISTPRLPTVDVTGGLSSPPFLARDTASSLRAGTWWLVAGGVRTLIRGILESLSFRPRMFATGGEAEMFLDAIPEIDELVAHLALEGLALSSLSRGNVPAGRG